MIKEIENLILSSSDIIKQSVNLSNNIEMQESERKKIYNEILSTPLFDAKKFSTNLKEELLKIYKRT